MIPKVIHYCWFGHGPLPKLALRCIKSWQKYFPDYEIKCWDESNFDVNIMPYTAEAYAARKYAFVSDVARFWILYNYGGVYFDTDVEVIASMAHIIDRGPFLGCEAAYDSLKTARSLDVAPGLGMAVMAGDPFYKDMLDYYATMHFKYDLRQTETIVDITTEMLYNKGMINTGEVQTVCGISIYPKAYFNPIELDTKKLVLSAETVSIHHYMASWASPWDKFKLRVQRCIGPEFTGFVQTWKHRLLS